MNLGMRFVRGLGIAGFVLGGMILSVTAVGLTAGNAYAQAPARQTSEASSVNSIVVEGNRRVEAATIRSYFHPGPSGRLDAQAIDDAYKALYATNLFQDVRISQGGGHIVVTLVENPVIDRIAFEGNKKVKEDQLKGEIQSKERGTLSRATVQSDVQRIVDVYRRSGRFDVRVDPKIIECPNSRVDLVFEINEGPKTDVKTIKFVGNHAFSSYRLKDEIKTVETGLLPFLQTNNIYDPDRLEADRELLRRFYLKHGYIDVRVVSAVGEYDPSQEGFIITFTIDDGAQDRIGSVDVRSKIAALNPHLVEPRLRMSAGDVYNAEAIEKSVEDMTIEAAKQGFAFATVRPGADRNNQARTVNLIFTVDEGQRTYIERINIRGNSKTRDYVIRREFDVAEGDAYNRALVSRPIASSSMSMWRISPPAKYRSQADIRPRMAPWRKPVSVSAISSGSAWRRRSRYRTASIRKARSSRLCSRICSDTDSPSGTIYTPSSNCRPISSLTRPIRWGPASGLAFRCARTWRCNCATRSMIRRSCCQTS